MKVGINMGINISEEALENIFIGLAEYIQKFNILQAKYTTLEERE